MASTFDDFERPQPILDAVVPRLQALLRADFGVAYRAAPVDGRGWQIETLVAHSDDGSIPFLGPFREYIAATPGAFAWYDAIHPTPDHRNVVRIPYQILAEREILEHPIMQKVFAPCRLERYDQMRVLLCDGSTLMAWFGGIRKEPFSLRDKAALAALIPSMRTRLRLERRLSKVELLERGLVAALDLLASAAFVVGADGTVVHANLVGRTLLDHAKRPLASRLRAYARGNASPGPGGTCISLRSRGLPDHVLVVLATLDGERAQRLSRARERWRMTARQLDVLALVAQGDANKAIAEKLRCAPVTVEIHVSALLAKAGVKNRTELVAKFWTTL